MRVFDYARGVWSHVMQDARPKSELEEMDELSDKPHSSDDGPEFSSEPMPAAFSAILFLGIALLICVLLVIFL